MATNPTDTRGPLAKLLGADLPPIPTVERIDVMPVEVDLESFRDCNGKLHTRPRGEGARLRAENRQRAIDKEDARVESIRRAERQVRADANLRKALLDEQIVRDAIEEWDPDWRYHYGTFDSAECNYHRAMAADAAARLAGIER